MITVRELRAHENAYRGFVRLVVTAAATILVVTAIVIGLISR